MGWNAALTDKSAVGSTVTYTPDTTGTGAYTAGAFTAPKKGVYCFSLKGSGGNTIGAGTKGTPGEGGSTVGYMLMEKGQRVYVGAGGYCSAAFVSTATGDELADIAAKDLLFIAGAGGQNGAAWDNATGNYGGNGGKGGGLTGEEAPKVGPSVGGKGGTQTAGGAAGASWEPAGTYGKGGNGGYGNVNDTSYARGRGGDGYYGGGSGQGSQANAAGGGGGSGYIYRENLRVNSKTYTNSTVQGGGAAADTVGSVAVTFYARAELPILFNGAVIEELICNGTQVERMVYNGAVLFMHRIKAGAALRWKRLAAHMPVRVGCEEAFA